MPNQSLALLTIVIASLLLGCADDSNDGERPDSSSDHSATSNNDKSSDSRTNEKDSKTTTPRIPESDGMNTKAAPLQVAMSSFVSADTFGAVVLYPRQLLADPDFSEVNLAQLIDEAMPGIGGSVTDLEQVVWLLSTPEKLRRTLVATHLEPSGAGKKPVAPTTADEALLKAEPPVDVDDLFEGLEPAKPVPPDEDRGFDPDAEFEPQVPDASSEETGFHAFDIYWTPKFMPMILRFAESSKADHFAHMLTKEMSEVAWKDGHYFKQETVSGKPPTITPGSTPAIRQYLSLGPMSVYLPDAHTVVLATEPRIQEMLNAAGEGDSDSGAGAVFERTLNSPSAVAGATAVIDLQQLRESGNHESLLEELSNQFLSSRMALLNLADDAGEVTLKVDVSADRFIQLVFTRPGDLASREKLARGVKNFVSLVSEYKAPQLESLASILAELAKGLSIAESESSVTLWKKRPDQFQLIPPVLAALLGQVVSEAEEALWRHSFEQIAFAMQIYAAEHQRLPPSTSYDESGKPLLSWRVHLLPYLGHDDLYEQFHLDEPWNGTHNITLLDRMPSVYGKSGADTRVLVFTGPGTLFDRERETPESALTSKSAASRILLVRTEETKPVAWTEPRDLDVSNASAEEVLGNHGVAFLAAFCDGTVRLVVPANESQPLEEMVRPGQN
jgi:hypothetical protein